MLKYLVLASLSLCACSGAGAVAAVPAPKHASILPPVVSFSAADVVAQTPVNVELPKQRKAQVLRCSDELQCFQKLTGLCANGYKFGEMLHAGNDRVVGILFQCITDEEKAEAERREAEEKAQEAEWKAERAAAIEAAKKQQHKTPAKK